MLHPRSSHCFWTSSRRFSQSFMICQHQSLVIFRFFQSLFMDFRWMPVSTIFVELVQTSLQNQMVLSRWNQSQDPRLNFGPVSSLPHRHEFSSWINVPIDSLVGERCSAFCKSAIWWCNLTVPDRLDTTALATHKPLTQSCTPQSVYTFAAECTLPPRLTYNTRYPKTYCWHSCKWCLLLPNKLLEPNAHQSLPWTSTAQRNINWSSECICNDKVDVKSGQ